MLRNVLNTGSLTIVGRVVGLVSTILLTRMLGPAEYGYYSVALTLLTFATLPALSGMPELMTREVAARGEGPNPRSLASILRPTAQLALGTSVLLLLVAAALFPLFSRGIDAYDPRLSVIIAVLIPIIVARSIIVGVIRGLHRVSQAVMPRELIHPLIFAVVLLAWRPEMALPAFVAQGLAVAGSAVVAVVLLYRAWPTAETGLETAPLPKSYLIKAGVPFALIGILAAINQRVDVLILGAQVPADVVGLYSLAVQLALVAQLPLVIVNGVIAPRVAQLNRRGDRQALANLMRHATMIMSGTGLAGYIAFVFIGPWLIEFAFGQEFAGAYHIGLILLAAQLFNLACGPVGLFLNLSGHEMSTLVGLATAAVMSLGLNILLVPLFGPYGAAIAMFASMVFWNAYLSFRVYRIMGISPGLLGLLTIRSGASQ